MFKYNKKQLSSNKKMDRLLILTVFERKPF